MKIHSSPMLALELKLLKTLPISGGGGANPLTHPLLFTPAGENRLPSSFESGLSLFIQAIISSFYKDMSLKQIFFLNGSMEYSTKQP
ncbi:MAG: hypothetical protein HQL69_14425 [Magnetococcales bacterium]|nr:hypothetical protein [Magnetococcales bacterium]